MKHYLDILIEDRPMEEKYIHVRDKSIYHDRLPLENPVLKVEVPNKDGFIIPRFSISEDNVYTTRSLKIYKDTKTTFDLSDGIYKFTYSICPNEETFLIQYHLRTTILENLLSNTILKYFSTCEVSVNVDNSIGNTLALRDLATCTMLIKTAKISAKNGNIEMAKRLYCKIENIINNGMLHN